MILGKVSFNTVDDRSSFFPEVTWVPPGEQHISFNLVQGTGLTGGYFQSARLPYTNKDYFYSDPEKGILVLLSGSVYNAADFEIREDQAKAESHPELIARLFLQRGPEFVRDLNGDFSIYLEVAPKKEAYLYRDHAGISPLAFAEDDGSLYFSTDPTGLACYFSGESEIDDEYLMDSFKYIDLRRTPVKKVKKLLPGHFLHYTDGRIRITRYWDPGKIRCDRSLTHDRMLGELKALLINAVHIRCDNRFTAGAHVSGGIDSGIIAALARQEYSGQEKFCGFSWSPADYISGNTEQDERTLVRLFCKEKNIAPVFSDLDAVNLLSDTSVNYTGRVYFSENRVVRQAQDRGVNLIFSGWGGDEYISTADRGIETDLLRSFKFREFLARNPVRPFRRFAKYLLTYVVYPYFGILPRPVRVFLEEKSRYLYKPFRKSDRRALKYFHFFRSRRQLHLRLFELYHIQDRCESWAVSGFWHGIEYRYPLLDKRIIEYMVSVPSELLCKTDYYRPLLREISGDILPGEVRFNWSKTDHL